MMMMMTTTMTRLMMTMISV